MKYLAFESSCDETAAAVVCADGDRLRVLSNIVASQIGVHRLYGGVVPEIASRAHIEAISGVTRQALEAAELGPEQIDAVGVTASPGLIGALLVGVNFAKAFCVARHLPLVPVHHVQAHIAAAYLTADPPRPPFLALAVSGGNTELLYVKDYGVYKELGRTRDDAAGEAFDKVAKLLGLPYPGGPQVSKQALEGKRDAIHFPRPLLPGTWDFSFSGIKTAVSYYLRDHQNVSVPDVCASFETAVVETLVSKTVQAALKYKVKHIAVGGGVAGNTLLRQMMEEKGKEAGLTVRFVERKYSSDNAAMIALAAYKKLARAQQLGQEPQWNINVNPNMKVRTWR